jgi:DNA-binding ferritin-like protein
MECRRNKNEPEKYDCSPVQPEELRAFMATVTKDLKQIAEVKTLVQNLEESVKYMSDKFDEFEERVQSVESKCKRSEETVHKLMKTIEEKDDIIADLEARMVNTEQYLRNKNIEIINVEQRPNENLGEIMNKLACELDLPLSAADIDVMHRVPTRRPGAHPKIIVQFATRTIRERWLEKRRHAVPAGKIVEGASDHQSVLIYRHLSEHWRTLLWQARQKGRPLGFHSVFFKDNKIVAKRNFEDRNPVLLYTHRDLAKLS